MRIFLICLLVVVSITLIVSILLQPSKQNGLAGFVGGSSTTDTFFSKNKTRTFESTMRKLTVVCGVLFAVIIVLINVIK